MKTSEKPKPSHEDVIRALAALAGSGGLPEDEAVAEAEAIIAEVRAARPRPTTVGKAPDADEVRRQLEQRAE